MPLSPSRAACAPLLCAAMLAAGAPAQQQDDGQRMVVLGAGERPSTMLGTWLAAHPERFVIADIGLWLHDLVGNDMYRAWRTCEEGRRRELLATLTELCRTFGAADSRADGLAGVAHVARTLLAKERGGARRLPEPWRGEIAAVIQGKRAALACESDGEPVDWSCAVPNGAYERGDMDALFATTWYLRTCLEKFSAAQMREWQRALDALPAPAVARSANVDRALQAFFGTDASPMPGVIGDVDPIAVADRGLLVSTKGSLAERLDAVHRRDPGAGDDLRTSMFRVAHELAIADPADEWLQAFGRARWHRKWSDLADYAYVAVREVDAICRVRDIPPQGGRAQLLIEPLPEVFAALRRAYVAADAVNRIVGAAGSSAQRLAEIDDALALLAHQRAGTQPPAELLDRLWSCLESGFDERGPESPVVRLEGFDGSVRRSGCHLVHVPIRWQGKNEIALAFHWFVEARERFGSWQRVRR